MRTLLIPLLAAALAGACHTTTHSPKLVADLLLVDGRIETMDPVIGEVEALAALDGRILTVGANEAAMVYAGEGTRILDLEGKRALPGFIDGHAHFTGIGHAQQVLDLLHVRSWDEVIAMVQEAVERTEPGE